MPLFALGSPVLAAPPTQLVLKSAVDLRDLSSWEKFVSKNVECRPVKDIPGTYFCFAPKRQNRALLNQMMGRVSYFVEDPKSKKRVPCEDDLQFRFSPVMSEYIGHDIKGDDLKTFFAQLDKADGLKANSLEEQLRDVVMSHAQKNFENYAVIALEARGFETNAFATHELMHARFFLVKGFAERVKKFWREQVSEKDKLAIAKILSQTYKVEGRAGKELVVNEFQAFILQDELKAFPEAAWLYKFRPKYRDALLAALADLL